MYRRLYSRDEVWIEAILWEPLKETTTLRHFIGLMI